MEIKGHNHGYGGGCNFRLSNTVSIENYIIFNLISTYLNAKVGTVEKKMNSRELLQN